VELLAALSHAHGAGVVHRDIKPENVMIEHLSPSEASPSNSTPPPTSKPRTTPSDAMGDRVKVKLTDFGIAKLLDAQGVTSTGQVLGSPAHMAPEQIEGNDVDARADVFSLGVLLYECMVGHLPFEGSNPAQVLRRVLEGIYPPAEREKPEIGKKWSTILDHALVHDVADRFPDAMAMRDTLCDELKRLGISSPRGEIEASFDDPEGFTERHKKQTIAKLCDLAGKARREGNAVAAAADYNRALAYAPEDRELLKIVSSMHRAEARRRMAKRAMPPVLGAIAIGALAFGITRFADKHPKIVATDPPATHSATVASVPTTIASEAPSASVAPHTIAMTNPIPVHTAAPKKIDLTITIGTLRPPFGVKIALDGALAADAAAGYHLTLDGDKHVLTFTCAANACAPLDKVVASGDDDQTVDVVMRVLPATVTVTNPTAGFTYRIPEEPSVPVIAGSPSTVSMGESSHRVVHVTEYPSQRTLSVTLRAGKNSTVDMATAVAPENP
ncbi:MAG: protein kinase domain-containing protein, partial [Polyangiaceae bacterium]